MVHPKHTEQPELTAPEDQAQVLDLSSLELPHRIRLEVRLRDRLFREAFVDTGGSGGSSTDNRVVLLSRPGDSLQHAILIDPPNNMDDSRASPTRATSTVAPNAAPTPPASNAASPAGSSQPDIKQSPKDTSTVYDVPPADPSSRKRSSGHNVDGDHDMIEPAAKKRRMERPTQARTPSPTPEPLAQAEIVTTPSFDHEHTLLLHRSCALVLNHVGFEGATKEAMESFGAQVDTYIMKLMSYITESMSAARRVQPTAPDFEFAMRHMGLTSSHLKPHLNPPLSKDKTQLSFEFQEAEPALPETPAALLGPDLDGAADKNTRAYIPSFFPPFPSRHTYKSTPVMAEREVDPRKIREKATEGARNAEEALRKLVKFSKTGRTGAIRGIENNDMKKLRSELWEQAYDGFAAEYPASASTEERRISVDATKQFWRKPVMRGRNENSNNGAGGQPK